MILVVSGHSTACRLLARKRSSSHVRGTSGLGPTPDILSEMSALPLTPDVAGTRRVRGLLTHNGHGV